MASLLIFKEQSIECKQPESINCLSIKRLLMALKYYSMLDVVNNKDDQNTFIQFINEIYINLLNDYIHLVTVHGNQLQELYQFITNSEVFTNCNINHCQFTSRHHRTNTNMISDYDSVLELNTEIMDSLHFYLFHCFDVGLRTFAKETKDIGNIHQDSERKHIQNEFYDPSFSKMVNKVDHCSQTTTSFNRFQNNKKYSIQTAVNENDTMKNNTYLDELYQHLIENKKEENNEEIVYKLRRFVRNEQFDSESLMEDIMEILPRGNVSNHIQNAECIDSIQNFMKMTQINSSSFSIGYRFYYWPYYQYLDDLPEKDQKYTMIDHHGYKVRDLYITQKYSSFKEEIANYQHIDMQTYENIILPKVKRYADTQICKGIRGVTKDNGLHYDIYVYKNEAKLSHSNLLSVILYTDYTDLSCDFTSTFRKVSRFETLDSVKMRNSNYWWWSKLLRETVEIFGQCKQDFSGFASTDGLVGPFFTGMGVVMSIPEFNLRLCSPTSTSKQIQVAIKFSGDKGMLLQLNNDYGAYKLRAFNCSWLSRYKEEDERYEYVVIGYLFQFVAHEYVFLL